MKAKLFAMNSELRASEAERGRQFCGGVTDEVIYVALADVEENSLVLKPGMIVLFQIEEDKFGVCGRKVTSF